MIRSQLQFFHNRQFHNSHYLETLINELLRIFIKLRNMEFIGFILVKSLILTVIVPIFGFTREPASLFSRVIIVWTNTCKVAQIWHKSLVQPEGQPELENFGLQILTPNPSHISSSRFHILKKHHTKLRRRIFIDIKYMARLQINEKIEIS